MLLKPILLGNSTFRSLATLLATRTILMFQYRWYCTVFPIHLGKWWMMNIKYGPSQKRTIKVGSRAEMCLWFVLWLVTNQAVFDHNMKGWGSLCLSLVWVICAERWSDPLTGWKGFCHSLVKANKRKKPKAFITSETWYTQDERYQKALFSLFVFELYILKRKNGELK